MEKIKIIVDDVPFIIVDIEVNKREQSQEISFLTNIEDKFSLGLNNPLRITFKPGTQEPMPYVIVRKNLEGLIDRKTFYRLVDMSETHYYDCLLYTSPSPRDISGSRMPSSA